MEMVLRRAVSAILIFVLGFGLFQPIQTVFAEETQLERKKVTVGYFDSGKMLQGASDGEEKSGYGYEYLRMVANYTGWEYEYVYGEWSVLMEKFLRGEIDLMPNVSYTEERAEQMLFPESIMGTETYYICSMAEDKSLSITDLSTFNGTRIGVNSGSIQQTYLVDWIMENELDVEIVPYRTNSEDRMADMQAGIVDAIVELDRRITSSMKPLLYIAGSDFYLAVSKVRHDLLKELNTALAAIDHTMPYYFKNLQEQYFMEAIVDVNLTAMEKEYLSVRDTIRVGYMDNYLPYSKYDKNAAMDIGTVTDILDTIQEMLDLEETEVVYLPYASYDELIAAFWAKEFDVLAAAYTDLWLSERAGYAETSSYASIPMDLVYQGKYSPESIRKVAATARDYISAYYIADRFPYAERVAYDSLDECVDAVLAGEVDAVVTNDFISQYYLNAGLKYKDLHCVELPYRASLSFGVLKEDIGLLSLLNRGISIIPSSVISGSLAKYAAMEQQYTAEDFLRDYMWFIIIGAFASVMLVAALFFWQRNRSKQEKLRELNEKNAFIQRQNELLESALARARQASDAKTRFLSNMSHDMRTPMNAILGFAGLLMNRADDPAMREYAEKISVSSNQLLALIDDVLYMSDIGQEKMKLEEDACDLRVIVKELREQIEPDISAKRLQFSCDTDGIQNEYIFCDQERLKRALLNILTNAVKFTKPEGSIFFTIEQHGGGMEGYGAYTFRIRDTGIGMSKEFLQNIFDPFERARTSTESGVSGMGLGLPISKNIVESMKGTIKAESEEGVGTEIVIDLTFRCWEPEEEPHEEVAAEEITFAGKRLLLVEDNELNREIAYEILTDVGFIVEEAEDGDVAVEKVRQSNPGHFDAVLMDIQMPVMDGYTATREIRKLKEHKDIPIIALTANALEEDKRKALEAGMDAHVGKPIDLDKLFSAITSVIK